MLWKAASRWYYDDSLPKDAESAINATVQSGRFASADEMVDRLVRDYAQRTRQQPTATQPSSADASVSAPDPIIGCMRDHAELMDEIVADAYRHRQQEIRDDILANFSLEGEIAWNVTAVAFYADAPGWKKKCGPAASG